MRLEPLNIFNILEVSKNQYVHVWMGWKKLSVLFHIVHTGISLEQRTLDINKSPKGCSYKNMLIHE